MAHTFRSLAEPNYRHWFAGALISNTGTWMQRTAQDWLVLTYLTNNNASALGITMALQMGPQLIMFPFAGALADRFSKRMLLMVTQAALGAVGLLLFVLVVTDTIELWHVYVLALVLGLLATIDAPA
ncbi:MFS transporter, partial [Burkholderia multivorans]|uniref:MFS transporter n=1 Tax=Burkholderia multivorans TaxID=87883 RepID=UPI000DB5F02F